MYDIIKIVEGNFYLSFLFLVVALSRRKIAGVMPLIYTGVILLLVSEMIRFGGTRVDIFDIPLFYWLRFFAVIVWGMASLIGVFSRLSEAESGVVADEDVLLPSIPVSENNFVTEAERRRVELVNLIEELAEQRGIKVQVMSSQNYEPNPVIRVEVSNPEKQNGNLVYVSSATIILKSFPFRRFPLLFEVRLYNGIKKKSYTSVTRLASWEINKLLSILVGQMKIKSFRPSKARCWLWQLWLPKNKIAACSTRHPHAVLLFFMSLIFPPFLLFCVKSQNIG